MPNDRYIGVIIVASLISGIVGQVLMYSPLSDLLMSLDESGAYNIILCISPILIVIWVSLISGYNSTNFESGDKTQYVKVWLMVFLSTTVAYFFSAFITVYFYIFFIVSQPFPGTDPGVEFVGAFVIIPLMIALPALFNGLLLASFFTIGLWTKYYE